MQIIRTVLIFLFVASCAAPGPAQSKPAPSGDKSKASAETCDGALDIVPSKPMTFARKRRPAKAADGKEVKSEKKQSNQ